MNMKQAAQAIRDQVTMDRILSLYGYTPKHGVMPCPFHGERNPSLKIYPHTGGWHCFGCGRGGSVIDFVMEQEGCSFSTAVRGIDNAMELGLTYSSNPYMEEAMKRLKKAVDRLEKAFMDAIDRYDKELEVWLREDLWKVQEIEAICVLRRTAQQNIQLNILTDEMEWLEWKKTECDRMRKEVRTWKTNCLRREKAP